MQTKSLRRSFNGETNACGRNIFKHKPGHKLGTPVLEEAVYAVNTGIISQDKCVDRKHYKNFEKYGMCKTGGAGHDL